MERGPSQGAHAQSAIATKKRLYAKALDSITSTSRVSLASSNSGASLKRPATAAAALDDAIERASKRLRHSTSTTSILPTTISSKTATPKKDGSSSRELPNFAPWSQDAFLARLKTFSSVSVWHPKPDSISEVEWAKRGWVCVDVNTVQCKGGCEKRVIVDLESIPKKTAVDEDDDAGDTDDEEDAGYAFEQALAQRYKDVIITGHAQTCLWRKDGCKDDIYHLQVVRPSVWQPELRKRYNSILAIHTAIKNLTTKSVESASSNSLPPERLLKELPSDVFGDTSAETHDALAAKALDIALHGWRGTKESGTDMLRCDACFQRVGLWMYQPDYRPSVARSLEEDANDDRTLDLVELHREHCPWRNALSQKASGTLHGLNASQILQRVVSTYAREHKRRSNGQNGVTNNEADANDNSEMPAYSKEEVARQDKERESRLRKLKSLFSIKRRSTKTAPKAGAR